jgi:hypothetical protein
MPEEETPTFALAFSSFKDSVFVEGTGQGKSGNEGFVLLSASLKTVGPCSGTFTFSKI